MPRTTFPSPRDVCRGVIGAGPAAWLDHSEHLRETRTTARASHIARGCSSPGMHVDVHAGARSQHERGDESERERDDRQEIEKR